MSTSNAIRLSAIALLSLALANAAMAQGENARAKAREKIQQAFLEVLGRPATAEDVEHHLKIMEERQLKPIEVRKSLVMSEEGTAAIKRVFKEELGRDPNPKQLAKAQQGLCEGGTLDTLRERLRE